ncbi:MAG: resolvase [Rhodospirillaceae bacterium BRH_c57]|nr:MAG: resolvase [Rhodospirillaceae bacterium BRH_c57]KJS44113.1 MAG: resolvase [Rhodospirillaceae bacterium BRH_c57]
MTKRVAIYARVSTDQQTVQNQLADLQAVAERSGWTIVKVFQDEGISGAKGRDQRPAFDSLLKAATRREFDLIAAWAVDRLGRSLQDLVGFLSEVQAAGVDLYLHQQSLDTSTPAGRALFQILGVFSEFERSMIRARVIAGLERRKAQGHKLGRPNLDQALADKVAKALLAGHGVRASARLAKVSPATAHRIKNDLVTQGLLPAANAAE